jgi:hypothetical protein
MLRHLISAATVLSLLFTSGCLIESHIDTSGGGTLTLTHQMKENSKLNRSKQQLKSAYVEVTDAKQTGDGKATFNLKVKDFTKLSTAKFFKQAQITRTVDAEKGTTTINTRVKNEKPNKMPDPIKKFYGDEVKIVTTVPGEITATNATSKDGKTATWVFTMDEFYAVPEVLLNLTYKNPS